MLELSSVLDEFIDDDFQQCGDFNCPGSDGSSNSDSRLTDLFNEYNLTQHVHSLTHDRGNILDLIVTSPSPHSVFDVHV